MPSFRVTMTIGALAPGVAPDAIVPTAANAAAQLTTVEAKTVDVARGEPRVVVRFTASDDAEAARVAAHVTQETRGIAEVTRATITRRDGTRWVAIR